jgi:hypothetical protein
MSRPKGPNDLRTQFIASGDQLSDECYPELYSLSPRFMFRFLPRPAQPTCPEFLYVPPPTRSGDKGNEGYVAALGVIAQWNLAWESAQLRQQMFADDLQKYLPKIRLKDDLNVYILPRTSKFLSAYLPIYMLLPRHVIERFGLPPLRRVRTTTEIFQA